MHAVERGHESDRMASSGSDGAASFEEEWVREYLGREEARRFADESPPDAEEEFRSQRRKERRNERRQDGTKVGLSSDCELHAVSAMH